MITLLNYEKAQGGDYVCHFSVGSTDMTYAEAEKEFKKISDSAFVVSPETMSISFALGVPGYGSTITMHYNTGVTVFYKAAGEYTSDVIRGDEILDDPGAVDVSWKTIFEGSFESGDGGPIILPKTHDGKEYYAMTGCFPSTIVGPLEITENGHYGWPVDKGANEWTDEEWGQGPLWGVDVNVPEKRLKELDLTITQNGESTLEPQEGYDGFSKINLDVNVPTQSATILDDPVEVDVDWKTIFANNGIITAKTYDGTKYDAMTGCFVPEIAPGLEITENGHYGWPVDKDPSEWTDEEWGQCPLWGVDVNVPNGLVETTIVCTLNGEEYTADFGQIKEALRDKNSNVISFKLSNFDDLVTLGSATYYGGDMDYFKVNRVSSGDSGLESVFYNVKFTGDSNEMGHSEFMALLKAKIPYSFIEHGC